MTSSDDGQCPERDTYDSPCWYPEGHEGWHQSNYVEWPPAGTVVVDTADPATIERAARALHAKDCGCTDYDHGATVERGDYRDLAAAVLASLTDTGDNKETQQ